jgi:hypothetical protein
MEGAVHTCRGFFDLEDAILSIENVGENLGKNWGNLEKLWRNFGETLEKLWRKINYFEFFFRRFPGCEHCDDNIPGLNLVC